MKRKLTTLIIALLLAFPTLSRAEASDCSGAAAQESRCLMLGIWKLKAFYRVTKEGETIPWCDGVNGYLDYTIENMVFADLNCGPGTKPTDPAAKYGFMIHYAGTYTLDPETGKIRHNVLNSSKLDLIGSTLIRYLVRVDDRCAELSDHVTGSHLQGMLLVEAARQMLVSVTERFLLPSPRRQSYSFVFNGFEVRFHEFGFPIGTRLELELVRNSSRADLAFQFQVRIRVIQSGKTLFEMESAYAVWNRDFIRMKEQKMSQLSTENGISSAFLELAEAAPLGAAGA